MRPVEKVSHSRFEQHILRLRGLQDVVSAVVHGHRAWLESIDL